MKKLLIIALLIWGCEDNSTEPDEPTGNSTEQDEPTGMCIAPSSSNTIYCRVEYTDKDSCNENDGNENYYWDDSMNEEDCDELQGGG